MRLFDKVYDIVENRTTRVYNSLSNFEFQGAIWHAKQRLKAEFKERKARERDIYQKDMKEDQTSQIIDMLETIQEGQTVQDKRKK